MKQSRNGRHSFSKGGIFRRLIVPLMLLILVTVFFSLSNANRAEKERHHDHLRSIVASNAGLVEKLDLPQSARLAGDLSATAGVTILFSGAQNELISSVPLSESEQELGWKALESPNEIVEFEGNLAVAELISTSPSKALIALRPGPAQPLFDRATLTPALLSGFFLALAAAFLISRGMVMPLGKLATEVRENPGNTALTLPSQLLERRDEIGILARELCHSREQLIGEQKKRERAERLALLGQLTTSFAHEIKNPAASIIMHGQALEKHQSNEIGSLIQEEGEQIVSLVDQWLFVAKPEGTQQTVNDLVGIISHLLKKLEPLLEFHAVTVSTDFPDQLPFSCDSRRMEQVFRNLISNSIQAMPDGGAILISLQEDEESLNFSVRDDGKGFSEQALSHFGEAFYSEREGGLGLGLTLVNEVIKAHGGEVVAQNHSDGGALVTGRIMKSPNSSNHEA